MVRAEGEQQNEGQRDPEEHQKDRSHRVSFLFELVLAQRRRSTPVPTPLTEFDRLLNRAG
jgi:hypothetical protein